MQETFILNPAFSKPEDFIADLELCRLVLHDNRNFPWIILIPKLDNLVELIDLPKKLRYQLMDEIVFIEEIMEKVFNPEKLNVATLGNITSQLHIHIIARYKNDLAWPNSVFGKEQVNYKLEEKITIISNIRQEISNVS